MSVFYVVDVWSPTHICRLQNSLVSEKNFDGLRNLFDRSKMQTLTTCGALRDLLETVGNHAEAELYLNCISILAFTDLYSVQYVYTRKLDISMIVCSVSSIIITIIIIIIIIIVIIWDRN
jgi:hypothetical protein